jgi:N-acetylmuramoyl-L-alanine amidase
MTFLMKHPIKQSYLPNKTKRRSGLKNAGIVFIVSHDTGNSGSTAANNVNYYKNSANEMSASAHTFIDDKEIIECIPLNEKAWHVLYNKPKDNQMFGVNANDAAIGVELCYGGKVDTEEAYKRYVWYTAYLCDKYGLNPQSRITGHHILDPGRKTDPVNALKTINKTFAHFLADVVKEYNDCRNVTSSSAAAATVTTGTYRIYTGTFDNDAKAEAAAFKIANLGFKAFFKNKRAWTGTFTTKESAERARGLIEESIGYNPEIRKEE